MTDRGNTDVAQIVSGDLGQQHNADVIGLKYGLIALQAHGSQPFSQLRSIRRRRHAIEL